MFTSTNRKLSGVLALSLGLLTAACGGHPTENRSLYSARQPVVERSNFTFDVNTAPDGIPFAEQQRLADWFEAMDLRYGDRVSIDDGSNNQAVTDDLAAIAGRYGLILSDGTPVTNGFVTPAQARVIITRSVAYVPDCPNWSANAESNEMNATYPGFGCAVNGNLAGMVADPEDLLTGKQGTGETVVTTSTRAIEAYREQAPSGAGGLPAVSSTGG